MEQRECYRVATHTALDEFQLTLELPDGRRLPARMDDVSARGLMARTQPGASAALEQGTPISLHISCPAQGVSLRLRATVRGLQRLSQQACYGIAFHDPEGLEGALPPDLFSLFNRRRTPRMPIDRCEHRLDLATEAGRRTVGSLRDLSLSGASISIPAAQDPGFCIGQSISLVGRAANSAHASHRLGCGPLRARVRRVRHAPGAVLYGIEFDWQDFATADRQAALESLMTEGSLEPTNIGPRRIAERRVSRRARPRLDQPVEVVLVGANNRSARATLKDLSASGAGVVVRALEDPEFCDDEPMRLELRLPGGPLGMIARVRRGFLIDDQVCYGLEFDTEANQDFEDCQEHILEFLGAQNEGLETPPLVACS